MLRDTKDKRTPKRFRAGLLIMRFEPFELERWLSTHSGKYNFAGVNPPPVKIADLVGKIDPDTLLTYGPTCGSPQLREEISQLYSNWSRDGVLVTNGTAEANFLAANAIFDKGDELVLVTPNYLQILGIAKANGVKVRVTPLQEEENYKPNLKEIGELVSSKTKAVFVTNPNNPTGATLPASDIRAICEIAEDYEAYVIFDEVIRGLELDGNLSVSPVEIYERGISTASISKLGLLGLRIGWVAANEQLIAECWKIKDYTTLSHSGLSEHLASIALQEKNVKWLRTRARDVFNRNLLVLREWLKQCDQELSCVIPTAGGSAFPKYSAELDSYSFCEKVLQETGILLSPGDCFGSLKHFRLRYGGHDVQALTNVLDQLTQFLKNMNRLQE
jgi:aspartate/methionine/tyrosine aminotransferase